MASFFLLLAVLAMAASPVAAQERPELPSGESTWVSIVDSIVVDGDLSDWANVASIVTSTGPTPAADPANTGSVTWQVAAVGQTLVFSATVVDSTIVAGQHGDDYWNEDSLELYVNFSGVLDATSYGSGIAQITFSPVDIGNTDPTSLTISGNNASEVNVSGFVFATADGWGVEAAVDLDGLAVPVDGGEFGLQLQANGSSGGDRDTKLSWSLADVNDQSFSDPSVFGRGIFADETSGAAIDEPSTDTSTETAAPAPGDAAVDAVDPATDEALDDFAPEPEVDESVTPPVAPDEAKSRTLLIAAVLAAASIMAGGFWFEHRRKADEERRAAAVRQAAEAQLALGPPELENVE